jgi:hypothetical protein
VRKRKGCKLGMGLRSKAELRRISALGRAALIKSANERAEAYRMHIEWALRQPGLFGNRPISFRAAAINSTSDTSRRGGAVAGVATKCREWRIVWG